jgi:hypothetical protein
VQLLYKIWVGFEVGIFAVATQMFIPPQVCLRSPQIYFAVTAKSLKSNVSTTPTPRISIFVPKYSLRSDLGVFCHLFFLSIHSFGAIDDFVIGLCSQ